MDDSVASIRRKGYRMKRMGFVIGIHPERIEEYKRLHANVWPD
jgi:hypothetical protein